MSLEKFLFRKSNFTVLLSRDNGNLNLRITKDLKKV